MPVSREWCFQIDLLSELRSAEKLDADRIQTIWTSITNNQFYVLAQYVAAFTGIQLKGYGQKEDPEAFESSAQTLDALQHIVKRMNESQELVHFADVVTRKQVEQDFENKDV